MDNKIEELKKDLSELEALQSGAVRQRTKNVLDIEIRKIQTEISTLERSRSHNPTALASAVKADQVYSVKLSQYAWDQSDKFVKLYVTLPKVHTIPAENVFCNFTDKSLELHVKGLEGKNYYFTVTNLLKKISTEQSTWKVKSDMVLINAAKVEQTNWSHVTEFEKKAADAQKLGTDDDTVDTDDPSHGIMNMMKKMYEKGDDEMKRTIAKAWTESQNKMHGSPLE